jgi:hypothetical protein
MVLCSSISIVIGGNRSVADDVDIAALPFLALLAEVADPQVGAHGNECAAATEAPPHPDPEVLLVIVSVLFHYFPPQSAKAAADRLCAY